MRKSGFTLVEIMVVVGIVGVLAVIAIPNFMSGRQRAQTNLCISNLRLIEDAKSMWAVWEGKTSSDTPGWDDLVPDYIQRIPSCPQGGTYTIGTVDVKPACSRPGHELT